MGKTFLINPVFDEVIIPTKNYYIQNTKNVLKYIKENIGDDTFVSVMAQYFPTYKAKEDELINRKLTKKEYKEIEKYFYLLDFKNGYMQELGEHEEEYVPNFDLTFWFNLIIFYQISYTIKNAKKLFTFLNDIDIILNEVINIHLE